MKIKIILARGIEGAGVSACAMQYQNWFNANRHQCEVFALDDKRWPRRKGITNSFQEFKVKDIKSVRDKCNDSDYVLYFSIPSKKHSEEAKRGCIDYLIKEVKPTKILFQFDHNKMSFSRNHDTVGTCALMDAFVTHSLTSDFANIVRGLAPIYKMGFGVDYDKLIPIRKPQEKLIKKATYFSRVASFKDTQRIFDLFPMLSKAGIITEANGIERSIGALSLIMDANRVMKPEILDYTNIKTDKNTMDMRGDRLDKIYTFGPYQRDLGLECLSYSMFGADFYHLKPHMYGDNFENAMCEIIGVGSVPMFDAHFAENCKLRGTDTYFKDIPNFAVWSDRKNLQGTVDQMVEIANNPSLLKTFRETGIEVARQHSDINHVMNDIVKTLEQIKKKTNYVEVKQEPQDLFS